MQRHSTSIILSFIIDVVLEHKHHSIHASATEFNHKHHSVVQTQNDSTTSSGRAIELI